MSKYDIETTEAWVHQVTYREVQAENLDNAIELIRSGSLDYDEASVHDSPGLLLLVNSAIPYRSESLLQTPPYWKQRRRLLAVTDTELLVLRELLQERLQSFGPPTVAATAAREAAERLLQQVEKR